MRFAPRKVGTETIDPDGLRYIGRWPRSESQSISDNLGGWLTNCMVKVGQGAWIFAILVVGLVCGLLTLWSLPAEAWWMVLTAGYFGLVLYLPWLIVKHTIDQRDWTGIAGSAAAFVLLAAVALRGFERLIWDPLDQWTAGFFNFSLPVVNGWAILMMAFIGITVVAAIVKNAVGVGGGLLGTLGSLGVWLWTCDYTRPGLMFYLLLAAVDLAYAVAAYGTIAVLWHEQGDVYEPYGSESPEEKPEPEVQIEHQITPYHTWPRDGTEETPKPKPTRMPTIASKRPAENKLDCEILPTSLRMDEFVEFVGQAEIWGLGKRRIKLSSTGREITQWYQWFELVEPLVATGIYDRAAGKINPEFDHDGRIDAHEVLETLELEQYAEMLH